MELKVVLMQFALFTLVEGAIYATFFYRWCKCNKFKLYQILIMSIGNYIISTTLAPVLYQCVMAVWMGVCICFIQKKFRKRYIGYGFLALTIVLVIEMVYCFILEQFGINILMMTAQGDISELNNLVCLFAYLLPTKCVEIIIFSKWGVRMSNKSWAGTIVRK